MAKHRTPKQLSQAAKKGWATRRKTLRHIQATGVDRRQVGKWYREQIDRAVEKKVKKRLKKELSEKDREIAELKNQLKKNEKKKAAAIRRQERKLAEQEEILKSPRKYIERTIDKLWDKYGREGDHKNVKKKIEAMAKRFSWPKDDLWHWYFSPTWK